MRRGTVRRALGSVAVAAAALVLLSSTFEFSLKSDRQSGSDGGALKPGLVPRAARHDHGHAAVPPPVGGTTVCKPRLPAVLISHELR